ncbi:hypothetical protein C8J55DRAFT_508339 [Lentinula edodes]|uniref:Uncharacterized protein n=1 Tax=Lentinula lateritia TaxID=40482 RepID=A0A9W9DV46_9AGAR|nr:hypothetical protein C8J55DRAFT_508339 [Lentinula edodes]
MLRTIEMMLFLWILVLSQLVWGAIVQVAVNEVEETSPMINNTAINSPVPVTGSISLVSTSAIGTAQGPSSDISTGSLNSDNFQLASIIGESVGGAVALGGFIVITLILRRTARQLGWPGNPPRRDLERGHSGYGTGDPGRKKPSPLSLGKQRATDPGGGDQEFMLQTPNHGFDDSRGSRNQYTSNPDTPFEVGMSSRARMGPRPNPRLLYPSNLSGRESERSSNIDINALAKEVAKILMQPPAAPSSIAGDTIQVDDWSEHQMLKGDRGCQDGTCSRVIDDMSRDTHSPAPPLYQSCQSIHNMKFRSML